MLTRWSWSFVAALLLVWAVAVCARAEPPATTRCGPTPCGTENARAGPVSIPDTGPGSTQGEDFSQRGTLVKWLNGESGTACHDESPNALDMTSEGVTVITGDIPGMNPAHRVTDFTGGLDQCVSADTGAEFDGDCFTVVAWYQPTGSADSSQYLLNIESAVGTRYLAIDNQMELVELGSSAGSQGRGVTVLAAADATWRHIAVRHCPDFSDGIGVDDWSIFVNGTGDCQGGQCVNVTDPYVADAAVPRIGRGALLFADWAFFDEALTDRQICDIAQHGVDGSWDTGVNCTGRTDYTQRSALLGHWLDDVGDCDDTSEASNDLTSTACVFAATNTRGMRGAPAATQSCYVTGNGMGCEAGANIPALDVVEYTASCLYRTTDATTNFLFNNLESNQGYRLYTNTGLMRHKADAVDHAWVNTVPVDGYWHQLAWRHSPTAYADRDYPTINELDMIMDGVGFTAATNTNAVTFTGTSEFALAYGFTDAEISSCVFFGDILSDAELCEAYIYGWDGTWYRPWLTGDCTLP